MKQPNANCANCGAPLYRAPWRLLLNSYQFCNAACYREWRSPRSPIEIPCVTCGTYFRRRRGQVERSERAFCSRKCRITQINIACTNCGTPLSRAPYRLKGSENAFCDNQCHDQYRKKRVVITCTNCGRIVEKQPYQVAQVNLSFCNQKCAKAWQQGSNRSDWKGGFIDYRGPNWEQQARRARERDGQCCQVCGAADRRLDVHHIVPFRAFGYVRGENDHYRSANHLSNLITLCLVCHPRVEAGLIPCPMPEDY